MDLSKVTAITIPEGVVTKIGSDGKTLWQLVTEKFKNWVRYSINADGTIYNGTGYKGGYRLSSSGVEKAGNYNTAFGYIPVKGGDTILFKVKGKDGEDVIWADGSSSTNYICVYKSDFTFLYAGNAKSGYSTATFVESMSNDGVISTIKLKNVANIAYFRMSVYDDYSSAGIDGNTAVITINEEIV